MKKVQTNSSGLTLIEITLSMSIFGILIVSVVALLIYYLKNYSFSFAEHESVSTTQTAITTMIREIRELRKSQTGSWPIVEALDNSFTFYSDVTNDGQADRVRYFLSGHDLTKGVIEPTGLPAMYVPENEVFYNISSNVQSQGLPLFTYYNGDWPADQIQNPLIPEPRTYQTRFIRVYLRIAGTVASDAAPFEISTGTMLQNLKDNL
ncbi:hypothetical protein A2154_02940 [Candidatus Gottesmanbacteria bacterium RBG_16_43_7]|uniref:Type II secretion system protein J n=1 Tax=Candidatus Gottesmanbacteria bacterium RBG_16_43_7 TaxID=1798373 RepID=A0A1F5Z9B2_9BACT|nr:MAG: hypothetical protein A2154_02940 [Candidatus Gottesmanbacteria bacterium RBG_16_43_7]